MGCGCGGSCGGGSAELTPPVLIESDEWGPDRDDYWRQLEEPARALFIAPGSEVDAVIVKVRGMGELVCSVEHPLVDIPLPRGTNIKPFASAGLTPNVMSTPSRASGNQLSVRLARLRLHAFDRVPIMPPEIRRSPRRYDRVTFEVNTGEQLLDGWHLRGSRTFSLWLENLGASALDWRVVGHKFGANAIDGGSDDWPISPASYPYGAPTYNSLAAATNESYHLDVDTDDVDMLLLYGKVAAGTLDVAWRAEVRD